MDFSTLLGKTLRQPPADAHLASHQLLARAGYVRGLEGGLFTYLPLGSLVLRRLRTLIQDELVSLGGQRVELPLSSDLEPVPTLVHLVGREIDSYRQLPVLLFRMVAMDLPQSRSRAGMFGASQRPVVEIHAFGGVAMADVQSQVGEALERILATSDIPVTWAEAGSQGRLACFGHASGDQSLVSCPSCGYAAERPWASTTWPDAPEEQELPPEEIETPGCDTIAGLAKFLDIPASRTLKMVFYSVEGRVTCVVIRGDRAVDEAKLARLLGTDQYYASLLDELAAVGAVGGYASPIGLDKGRVRVVADPSARAGKNFVSGANRPDYHIRNVNLPRDFVPGEWVDLALIEPGDPCPRCSAGLQIEPIFVLVEAGVPVPCQPDAEYLDQEGRGQPLWMVSWHLDLGRLLAAIVETHHDDYGILWPAACAPFDVHLVVLDARKEAVAAQAAELYDWLKAEGVSVLCDARTVSAGVKFNDADLVGVPLRLTVSKRSAKEGLIEAKWRNADDRFKLDEKGLTAEVARLRQLQRSR